MRVARRPAPLLRRLQVAGAAGGRGVAAVGERVHHDLGRAALGAHLDQRPQVVPAGVHPAVGDQADEVDALRVGERLHQHLVGLDRAVVDGVVDAGQVLLDHSAGAEVQVPHLGVAHLALGQAHRGARRIELGVRIARPEVVEDRRVGERDRVARAVGSEPEAVEHDQADGGERLHAAATIVASESTSSEAPPTRAPSTSGSASSSAALSPLTEPP